MENICKPKGSILTCPRCGAKIAKTKEKLTETTRLHIDLFKPLEAQQINLLEMVSCYDCGAYVNIRCVDNYKEKVEKVIITVEDIKIEVPVEGEEDYIVAAAKKLSQVGITIERGLREPINFELKHKLKEEEIK